MQKFSLLILPFAFWVSAAINAQDDDAPTPAASMAEFCTKLPRPEYQDLERLDDPDPWFELYRVAAGVTAIYEPYQWQEVISYLIEGDNKALLFDTGNGIADIHAVVDRITAKPVIVINSHSHYDHVGGNHAFKDVWGMDTDFTRERSKGIPNTDIAIEVSSPALCRPLPKGVTPKTHVGKPYTFSKHLKDGTIIELGKRQLEVLHIPGHTPDAIALIERETGLLWTGDTLYAGPIWLYAPETDLQDYARSLDRLVSEMPKLTALLPAHNTPLLAPEVIQQAHAAFTRLLNGQLPKQSSEGGTSVYASSEDAIFSFLLRDE